MVAVREGSWEGEKSVVLGSNWNSSSTSTNRVGSRVSKISSGGSSKLSS